MRVIRISIVLFALGLQLFAAAPAQAGQALPPGQKPGHYTRWFYPSQMPYGALENGAANLHETPSSGAFLTLPFMGPHYVTSLFDHCYPDYAANGRLCRWDGEVVSKSVGGPDPGFTEGYAQTPGQHDYLYYDGHDGYDYGLFYEPVAAAAPGRVKLAGWAVPSCHSCLSGLTVEISHGNGLITYYGHLSQLSVSAGQWVQRGQVIGRSGMTGTATGPHLHFGVYYEDGRGPVDPYGWAGGGADPWSKDLGDLWLGGSPRYASVPLPQVGVAVSRDPHDPTVIAVSWHSPGAGTVYQVQAVSQDGVMSDWFTTSIAGTASFAGEPGQTYWFWVTATTNLGWSDANSSPSITLPGFEPKQAQ
ncbi:MAG TPA: M23 family metallopeptidase [Candidatus Dormibacteraeota bacterium]|nr:M23 family metallopeptidase [Candidatus Dormibacteraeota bacterium]